MIAPVVAICGDGSFAVRTADELPAALDQPSQ
jgi:hypothetical protein